MRPGAARRSPRTPLLSRRRLPAALAVAATATATGCTDQLEPVPTDPSVEHDPLASLDRSVWTATTGEDLLALPLEGDLSEYPAWDSAGLDDASVGETRKQLADFLHVAYLQPRVLGDLRAGTMLETIDAVTPEFWKDDLESAWADGRHFYSYALQEGFAAVGTPHVCATWHRGQNGTVPQLIVAGTFAHTVIDTGTRDVGVVAQRIAMRVDLGAQGEALRGIFQVTLHGIDLCATGAADGRYVPAISTAAEHETVQSRTMEQVIGSPDVARDAMDSTSENALLGDEETVLLCS